jgi:hypothetical protein
MSWQGRATPHDTTAGLGGVARTDAHDAGMAGCQRGRTSAASTCCSSWYNAGDVEIRTGNPDLTFRTSAASAQHWKEVTSSTGALLVGRHLYDFVNGWGGRHLMDVTTVVLTHRLPQDRPDAGLLDEISVDLVPVILGGGTPFFSSLGVKPVQLDGPISAVEGIGVTHLSYRVRKDA